MRYAYAVASGPLPWLRAPLPTRYSAKAVAAIQGIVLVLAASGLVPVRTAAGLVAIALGLLVWSFGHDVVWLWRRRASGHGGRFSAPRRERASRRGIRPFRSPHQATNGSGPVPFC